MVRLRAASLTFTPQRPLVLPDANNFYFAGFIQDDWRVTPRLTLNLGLRYELDTDVKNISRIGEVNPLELAPLVRDLLARIDRGERDQLRREKLADLEALMEE